MLSNVLTCTVIEIPYAASNAIVLLIIVLFLHVCHKC